MRKTPSMTGPCWRTSIPRLSITSDKISCNASTTSWSRGPIGDIGTVKECNAFIHVEYFGFTHAVIRGDGEQPWRRPDFGVSVHGSPIAVSGGLVTGLVHRGLAAAVRFHAKQRGRSPLQQRPRSVPEPPQALGGYALRPCLAWPVAIDFPKANKANRVRHGAVRAPASCRHIVLLREVDRRHKFG